MKELREVLESLKELLVRTLAKQSDMSKLFSSVNPNRFSCTISSPLKFPQYQPHDTRLIYCLPPDLR
jgi:hypothetical protein